MTDIRETVRQRYADAAGACTPNAQGSSCCSGGDTFVDLTRGPDGQTVFGGGLYGEHAEGEGIAEAIELSLGCGVPTAVADLHPGEIVLDLGSGAGGDVLLSALRVAPDGKAIGLDMTTEMLERARSNAEAAGIANVEFLQGYLEEIPLPADSVDVIISNCVLNLAADKTIVMAEAARVLRPGGRLAISDVVADDDMDEATRADMAEWTGCIAGAMTESVFQTTLLDAGFTDVEITPTHRVHEHASAAIVRAHLPVAY